MMTNSTPEIHPINRIDASLELYCNHLVQWIDRYIELGEIIIGLLPDGGQRANMIVVMKRLQDAKEQSDAK